VLVKKLVTLKVKPMGGKEIATVQRMQKTDKPDEWTQILVKEIACLQSNQCMILPSHKSRRKFLYGIIRIRP